MLFPKRPIDTVIMVNSAVGFIKITSHMYEVPNNRQDDNLYYALSETEYPDTVINSAMTDKLDKFFTNSIKGAVDNVHGKLMSEIKVQINGYPGREIRADFQDGTYIITMRSYLVKNKMYILEIITAVKKDFNTSISKFMNSFALKNP
jgi:hypothetical protein